MHPVDALLVTLAVIFLPLGLVVWHLAHQQRLEDEADAHDIPAE